MNFQLPFLKITRYLLPLCICFGLYVTALPSAYAATTINKPTNTLGMVGHWTFDGPSMVTNVADNSGQGNHGNLFGQTATTTVQGKMGQALQLDGVDDYVDVGNSSTYDFTSGDFSVSFWVKATAPLVGNDVLVSRGSFGADGWYIQYNFLTSQIRALSNPSSDIVSTPASVDTSIVGVWNHIVLTKNGTTGLMYTNGVAGNSGTFSNPTSASRSLLFGAYNGGLNYEPPVVLDDVRIYSRALSAAEVRALYNLGAGSHSNASKNTSITSGLVGQWSFDGPDMLTNVADRSGNGNHGNLLGQAATTTVQGKIGQALKFDGTNDCVQTPNISYGSSIITTSFWLNWDSYAADDDLALESSSNFNAYNNTFIINPNNSSFDATAADVAIQAGGYRLETFARPSAGSWHLWSIVFDNSTTVGDVTVYIDGQVQSTTVHINDKALTGTFDTHTLYIMCRGNASLFGAGKMDDLRIYNRALTTTEIISLYNLGAGSHVNASQNTKSTNGLVGLWSFDGPDMFTNVADRSGNGNHGNLLGQALQFDGVDDRITIADNAALQANPDLTVTFWLKTDSVSSPGGLVAKDDLATNRDFSIYRNSDQLTAQVFDSVSGQSAVFTGGGTVQVGKWYFATLTYDSSDKKARIYLDTVLKETGGALANGIADTAVALTIGSYTGGSYPYGGLIDDVRIYNRVLSASELQRLYNLGR